jgi:ATP synthase F1 epsilon subunit
MENNFMFEIITPEKIIFSENINMVTIPSYEGDMTVLKNHISIISFLRPGMINVFKNEESSETFFVQDGTVEFFNNNMVVLSTSVENIKNLSKDFINNLDKKSRDQLLETNITDHDRYILNHQIETLKEINI